MAFHIRKKSIAEKVAFVNSYKHLYTIKQICKVIKFPRSTYYEALVHEPSKREIEYNNFARQVKRCILFEQANIYLQTKKNERSLEKTEFKIERVKEVRDLKYIGYSDRQIAKKTGLSRKTVANYLTPDFNPIHGLSGTKHLRWQLKMRKEIQQQSQSLEKIYFGCYITQ